MKLQRLVLTIAAFACLTVSVSAQGTRLLRSPTVSRDSIAFEYGGDLWVVALVRHCATRNLDARRRARSVLLTRRFADRVHVNCSGQLRRLRRPNRRRRSKKTDISSGPRSRTRLDAGRPQRRLRFSTNERTATSLLAFVDHLNRWRPPRSIAHAACVQRRVFARQQTHRLRRDHN